MSVKELGNDRRAESFLNSKGFNSLSMAMEIINASSQSETVGALAQVALENYVVNWAKGSREGYGISIAKLSDIKPESDTRRRGFPQLDLDKDRPPEQITIHTGVQTLSTFRFSAHEVAEDSSRVLAASLQKVKRAYGRVEPEMVDAILLFVKHGGGIRLYEKLYKSQWEYQSDTSRILDRNVDHTALTLALAGVS